MELGKYNIRFNIFKGMRYPSDVHVVFPIYVIDSLGQQMLELNKRMNLKLYCVIVQKQKRLWCSRPGCLCF